MFQAPRRAIAVFVALLLLPLAGCQFTPPPPPALEPASPDVLSQSIHYLASSELDGRGIGSPGLEAAAHYVAGYFRGLGLEPPPHQDDMVFPFAADAVTGLDRSTSLSTTTRTFTLRADFVPLALSPEAAFTDAPIAFVGYALADEPAASGDVYDDFSGIDLRGKVALAMLAAPHDPQDTPRLDMPRSPEQFIQNKAALAASHGAVALLLVQPPTARGSDILVPFGPHIGPRSAIPVMQITQSAADSLLKAARAPALAALQTAIDNAFSPRSFVLKRIGLSGRVAYQHTRTTMKNITACIRGRGPLAEQYIVIGAHYDHLGHGPFASLAPASHAMHPGADDNASGAGALLELARLFAQASRPARSLLFVAFSGEEEGLLGSRQWVEHPPVPLKKIVAMINLDMLGRLRGDTLYTGGQATAAAFSALLEQAEQSSSLRLKSMWNDGEAPSDGLSFLDCRIPILLFFTGMHEDYHRPSDTPDKINYAGEARSVDLIASLIAHLTTQNPLVFQSSGTQPAGSENGGPATSRPAE